MTLNLRRRLIDSLKTIGIGSIATNNSNNVLIIEIETSKRPRLMHLTCSNKIGWLQGAPTGLS